MSPRVLFVAAFAVLCIAQVHGEPQGKVNVDIYYESLCPDSINFIVREFTPAYKDFKDFINVSFIPFGKASWVSKDPPVQFTCQHGPNECRGNIAQACALREIVRVVPPEVQQQKSVDIVNCVMSNRNPANAVPQCAAQNGLSDESVKIIQDCSQSDLGSALLIAMGERTKTFESPLSFVPSIAVNGIKKSDAFRNFGSVVCQQIAEEPKPEVCRAV